MQRVELAGPGAGVHELGVAVERRKAKPELLLGAREERDAGPEVEVAPELGRVDFARAHEAAGEVVGEAVAREGLDIFVNARTDVYLKSLVPAERALDETLARGRLYRDAGADGLFVPALVDTGTMRKIADAIVLPLNVLIWKGLAPAAALKDAGVRRISAGAGIARGAYGASRRAIAEILDAGRYDTMYADAENCPNLNALMEG